VSQELAIPTDLLDPPERHGRADDLSAVRRLEDLYDRSHQRLYRLGCRMTGDFDAALDLLQETFLRAAGRAGSLPAGDSAAEAWLVRVLVNLCRDQYRKSEVRIRAAGQLPRGTSAPSPEAAAVARDLVRAALAALPPRRRAVIALHELEELAVPEVARLLGLAEVTVRWHLAVGRREMAARLSAPGQEG
jgi:RNA polymerase sigma-70 factor, ECF subfamily